MLSPHPLQGTVLWDLAGKTTEHTEETMKQKSPHWNSHQRTWTGKIKRRLQISVLVVTVLADFSIAFGNNYVFSLQLRTTQSYWMHWFGPSMETTVKRSTWTVPTSLANMILPSYKPSSTAHRGQTKLLQNHNLMCSTLRVQHISQLKIIAFLSLLMPE